MSDLFRQAVSLSLLGKCVAAVVGILLIHGTFRLLEKALPRRFGQADLRYRVRKLIAFSGYAAILLFASILFEDLLGRLIFTIEAAGAGVPVALQHLLSTLDA